MANFVLITAILLGIVIGIGASISREEKVKQAFVIGFVTIITSAIGGGLYLYEPTKLDFLFEFIFYISLGFLIAFFSGSIYRRLTRPKPQMPIVASIRDGSEEEIPIDFYGVKWLAYIPTSIGEYVWLDGAFCPECKAELETRKTFYRKMFWYCKRCDTKFWHPKDTDSEIRNEIKNYVYADVYRKKKFKK